MKHLFLLFFLFVSMLSYAQSKVIEDTESLSWEELYQKGKYYREHSNSFRAMQYLEEAEKLHSSDTIRRELALTYYNRGRFQKCIDLCRSVLYPDTLDSDLYLIARSFEKMEKADSALNYQLMVAERNIENYNNLATLCNTLINAGLHNDALQWIDAYCAIDSTNSTINTVKAFALHKAGKHKEAIRVYEMLRAEGDDRSSTNYYLGLSYYLSKNVSYSNVYAIDLLNRAVEQTQRKNAAILARFAVAELSFFPYDGHILNKAYSNQSHHPVPNPFTELMVGEESDYLKVNKIAENINRQGVADLEESIELMQPNKDMLFYLYNHVGNRMTEMYRPNDAIYYYNRAKGVFSNRFNLYYQMAVNYHRLKDYKNEMASYQKYIELAPEDEDPETIEYAKECIAECRRVLFMKEK